MRNAAETSVSSVFTHQSQWCVTPVHPTGTAVNRVLSHAIPDAQTKFHEVWSRNAKVIEWKPFRTTDRKRRKEKTLVIHISCPSDNLKITDG